MRIPILKEEIDLGFNIIDRLRNLDSPYLVKFYEGFSESNHGPYFTVTDFYPVI